MSPHIPLPGAERGAVVTRFPPEPSWLLDLGHCKAALLNEAVAAQYEGSWILRFDDTNPRACSQANVDAYLQDLPLLGLAPGRVTYASDFFEPMAATASALVASGFLYADDTPLELMCAQRLAKQASPGRARPVAASVAAWEAMRAGSPAGRAFCLRFRLDPGAENGALRDPVAWRVMAEPHYRSGTRFSAYPTYDFACPWLDAAEGVTHALRTLEFRDRDALYAAVQQAVLALNPGWRASRIYEFPRIHMAHTPQAKSHQRALLAAGLVDGPSDPRLPTLRGLLRAGCHPGALRAFLTDQVTPARKETYHSWDKLWTLNRRLLDPAASRHFAVADAGRVLLTLQAGRGEASALPQQPQPAAVAWKQGHVVEVLRWRQLWLDQADAQLLAEGDVVTLLAWGNARIIGIVRSGGQQSGGGQQSLEQPGEQPRQQQPPGEQPKEQQPGGQPRQQQPSEQLRQHHSGEQPRQHHLGEQPRQQQPDDQPRQHQPGELRQQQPPGEQPGQQPRDETAGDQQRAPASAGEAPQLQRLDAAVSQQEEQQQLQPPGEGSSAAAARPAAALPPGQVLSLAAELDLAGDPKASRLKLHWLPALPGRLLRLTLVRYGRALAEERVTAEAGLLRAWDPGSRREEAAWGDPSLARAAVRGCVVQLQRKGLWVVDAVHRAQPLAQPAAGDSRSGSGGPEDASSGLQPPVVPFGGEALRAAGAQPGAPEAGEGELVELVLIAIPDGHTKHERA